MLRVYSFLILMLLGFGECFGQLPRDESPRDPDFQRFRGALDQALIQKDLASLKLLFADTIYESNDGCGWPGCTQETFFDYYFVSKIKSSHPVFWFFISKNIYISSKNIIIEHL